MQFIQKNACLVCKSWAPTSVPHKISMIMHGSNPSILEVEAGGSEAQYNLQFHTESEVSWDT